MPWVDWSTAARRFGPRSHAYARHVWQKLAGLTIGRLFVSKAGLQLRATRGRFGPQAPDLGLRLAIVVHAYYPDLLSEVLDCRAVLPRPVPLHVTAPPDRIDAVRERLAGVPDVIIHVHENRGRDILPFVALLASGALDDYDAVLKIHTKRSPHLLDGDIRRKLLFAMLCGERNATLKALSAFGNPTTGIVGWQACWREAKPYWMANRTRVEQIAARMHGSDTAARLGFFEGSMFWFRPSALAALRDLAFGADDFEREAGQTDGTLHHAIERCFTIAAWSRGYDVRDLRGRILAGRVEP